MVLAMINGGRERKREREKAGEKAIGDYGGGGGGGDERRGDKSHVTNGGRRTD